MKWEEMRKSFEDQWILIKVDKVDDAFNVVEGEVLGHSKDKEEIYRKLLELRPKEFTIEYTGSVPEDLAIVMVTDIESV